MTDYKIRDINLAELGRTNLKLALNEMPALKYAIENHKWLDSDEEYPLRGAKISMSIHHTVQTTALAHALVALGAEVRCCSCNIFSTQDDAAACSAADGIPVFAWKGETEEEYWECTKATLFDKDGNWFPNLILDDGFDLSTYVMNNYPEKCKDIIGASEETSTGIHRAKMLAKVNELKLQIVNVNDCVTKQKTDNTYGMWESAVDGYKRATDYQIAGKNVVVIGYGQVGRGTAKGFRSFNGKVTVTEIDPLCGFQAMLDGFEVKKLEDVIEKADIVITTTGSLNVVDKQHFPRVKDGAVLMNVGHFDDEINTKWLRENAEWTELKPQVHRIKLKGQDKSFILLSEGRLANLGNAHGHSSFVMSCSFTNQINAQIHLWKTRTAPKLLEVYKLPKILDELTARIHLELNGGSITKQTQEQAEYTGFPVDGPFKFDDYLY